MCSVETGGAGVVKHAVSELIVQWIDTEDGIPADVLEKVFNVGETVERTKKCTSWIRKSEMISIALSGKLKRKWFGSHVMSFRSV